VFVWLAMDCYDCRSGRATWSASAKSGNDPGPPRDRENAVRDAVRKALSGYPPS